MSQKTVLVTGRAGRGLPVLQGGPRRPDDGRRGRAAAARDPGQLRLARSGLPVPDGRGQRLDQRRRSRHRRRPGRRSHRARL